MNAFEKRTAEYNEKRKAMAKMMAEADTGILVEAKELIGNIKEVFGKVKVSRIEDANGKVIWPMDST